MNRTLGLVFLVPLIFLASCGGTKPIVVGSKAGMEQSLLGEIVAQHLEARLGMPVERRLGFGDTPILYQGVNTGEITLYPDTTGILIAEVLREQPSLTPSIAFERARNELARTSLLELMDPLGFDNRTVVVIKGADFPDISTLSQAAEFKDGWKLGVSYEFQSRSEGLPVLNSYRLPMAAAFRSMEPEQLFPSLEQGAVTMIAAQAADGYLTSPDWKVLEDDMHVFAPQQEAVVVRQDAFTQEPRLKAALAELSGKFDLETVRKLNAQVVIDERPIADVAREFLASAGL